MKNKALEILVDSLFDHAGIFPPTERPLEEAYKVAATFDSILTRPHLINSEIVLPVKKLSTVNRDDLRKLGFSSEKIFRISALSDLELKKDSKDQVFHNLNSCLEFNERNEAHSTRVIAFDLKISADLDLLNHAFLTKLRESPIQIYLEPDLSIHGWQEMLLAVTDLLSGSAIGLKCRGTGPTGISNDRMAHALYQAGDKNLHFKVTGGFHHMVAGENNKTGFLSFASAFVLSKTKNLEPEKIEQILNNKRVEEFCFTQDALTYRGDLVSFLEIAAARKERRFSIGCCNPLTPDKELTVIASRCDTI